VAKRNWISSAISRPGALHRQLGIPMRRRIPVAVLERAAQRSGTLGRRARLALTLRRLNRRRGS
jgi:hypothetical protein